MPKRRSDDPFKELRLFFNKVRRDRLRAQGKKPAAPPEISSYTLQVTNGYPLWVANDTTGAGVGNLTDASLRGTGKNQGAPFEALYDDESW